MEQIRRRLQEESQARARAEERVLEVGFNFYHLYTCIYIYHIYIYTHIDDSLCYCLTGSKSAAEIYQNICAIKQ